MPVPVAAYGRVSSEKQEKKATIKTQVRTIQEWVAQRSDQYEIVEWYLDDGFTGTVPMEQRPRGKQLIADAMAGRFRTILIYDGDRISREEHIWPLFKVQMQNAGVNVISITEGWNTADEVGSFMAGISALLGAEGRKKMLKKMRDGRIRVAKEGRWPFGSPPYGYRIVDYYLVIFEEERKIVELIFDMYTERRMGVVGIANELNRLGIPTPSVNKGENRATTGRWNRAKIYRILSNPVYIGEVECKFGFHDDAIMIKVPSIITPAQWMKVKQVQADRWKEKTRNNHLLAGLVKCGHCGMSCSILKTKYGRYYRCNGKYSEVRGEGITCPGSPYANADKLEALIWNMIVSWARNPGQVLQEFIGQNSDMLGKLAEIREGIAEADAAVAKCQEQLERAVYGYTTEVLSLDELKTVKATIKVDETHWAEKKARLQAEYNQVASLIEREDATERALRELAEIIEDPEVDRRALVELLITRVEVSMSPEERLKKWARRRKVSVTVTCVLPQPMETEIGGENNVDRTCSAVKTRR